MAKKKRGGKGKRGGSPPKKSESQQLKEEEKPDQAGAIENEETKKENPVDGQKQLVDKETSAPPAPPAPPAPEDTSANQEEPGNNEPSAPSPPEDASPVQEGIDNEESPVPSAEDPPADEQDPLHTKPSANTSEEATGDPKGQKDEQEVVPEVQVPKPAEDSEAVKEGDGMQRVPSLVDMAKSLVSEEAAQEVSEKVKQWGPDNAPIERRITSLQDMAKTLVDEEAATKAAEQVKHWEAIPEGKVKKVTSLQNMAKQLVGQEEASDALKRVQSWTPPTIDENGNDGATDMMNPLVSPRKRKDLSLQLSDIAQQGNYKPAREQEEVGVDLDNFLENEAEQVLSEHDDNSHPTSPLHLPLETPKDMSSYSYSTILPGSLLDNATLLDDHEMGLATMLTECGQGHLFENWSLPPKDSNKKHEFFEQVETIHSSCGKSGIPDYIERAKALLASACKGANPLEGWVPSVPEGKALVPGSPEYFELEEKGLAEVGECCFVIVAGGLGERLGYNGVKLGLPSETTTGTCYLGMYAKYILALEAKHSSQPLPLAIMVSQDTLEGTQQLLKKHNFFGLQRTQVFLLLQEKVPALQDNDAKIALDSTDPYLMETKPHGHGDVHALLYGDGAGLVYRWKTEGRKWVVFLQDTNGLALFSLPAVLGVSASLELQVNSVAIPRKAKQAIGGITKLTSTDGSEMTLNVEYNQLEPLLKSTINPEGDVNDEETGYSPFPGNINQLVFELGSYCTTLERTGGMLPEFVNPKYADAAKTTFKKPTRLECMMQDYPRVLSGNARVGFTSLPEWCCFSPCKNSLVEARAALDKGVPPACASFAEADQYNLYAELLRTLGASILKGSVKVVDGIPVQLGPALVFDPSFSGSLAELKKCFPEPENITISSRSTLVIKGSNIKINSLQLDGALWIEVEDNGALIVKDLKVSNQGWEMVDLDETACEADRIRGYKLKKIEQKDVLVSADEGTVVIDGSAVVANENVTAIDEGMEKLDVADSKEVEIELQTEETQVQVSETRPLSTVTLPDQVLANKELLSDADLRLVELLIGCGQGHLFEGWSASPALNVEEKKSMIQQLQKCHESYPIEGGLRAYINRARELLEEARDGRNPLEGWTPTVPKGGVNLQPGSGQYADYEEMGLSEVDGCAFVFVAGGLGERLGYSGIKLSLPTETVTNKTYLELYIRQILALQDRYGLGINHARPLPLAIMVSDDTFAGTKALLEMYQYFGMRKEQIHLLKQEKVPALQDNDGRIALSPDNPYKIQAKPHGHGDVHMLLHSSGLARQWLGEGRKWVVLAQDTNGLAFFSLPACLGVSKSLDLKVNSVAIPRKAKQAIGGIATLSHQASGRQITVNVEYNQLEPLLQATVSPEGDTNDPATGYSPYPGNINQLIFELQSYVENLERTQGILSEFVNPKYADQERTKFKKPTRLECMMQDYPKALDANVSVGFTSLPPWICFSPCKNSILEARAAISKGVPPACAASAEQDQYEVFAEMLRILGANVHRCSPKPICNIPVAIGPMLVFDPSFVTCLADMQSHFPHPENITISSRSTLIVKGSGVVIESLSLDGALLIDVVNGAKLTIRNLNVHNAGYKLLPLGADSTAENTAEVTRIRGYNVVKMDCKELIVLNEQGDVLIDGSESDDIAAYRQQEKAKEKGCIFSLQKWLGLKKG